MTPKRSVKPLDALMTMVSCLGVIWGDIGTSPLYTYSSVYNCEAECQVPELPDVLETLSCMFWTLTVVAFFKYILILLRMDYHGEGGIFALLLNISRNPKRKLSRIGNRVCLGLAAVGASAMMADGFVTPALSVISAVEGLKSATLFSPDQIETIDKLIVPVTCVILVILFMLQSYGSTRVGRVFGPIMLLYFLSIAAIGLYNLISTGQHQVLEALSPVYTFRFFFTGRFAGYESFKKLSSVVLCVTGAEALYADLGHYSRSPIYLSWGFIVYPSLILAYAGQAAILVDDPGSISTVFWAGVPSPIYIPMLILATLATIVASQAMISGCYSLVSQAVALSLFPRVRVVNTDPTRAGQIYIPEINVILAIGCILLVIGFRSSAALAGAYGLSVVLTFNITTLLLGAVLYTCKWPKTPWYLVVLAVLPIIFMDMTFLASNVGFKIQHGAWITLLITLFIACVMLCWWYGRSATLKARESESSLNQSSNMDYLSTYDALAAAVQSGRIKRGSGIGVYLAPARLQTGRRLNLSSLAEAAKPELGMSEPALSRSGIGRVTSSISGIVPEMHCALPSALSLYLKVTSSIQPVVVLLHVAFDHDKPALNISDRVVLEEVVTGSSIGIYSATVTFGFAEPLSEVDMNKIVRQWILEQIPQHQSLNDLFEPSSGADHNVWYFLYKEEHSSKKGSNIFRRALVWLYSALHTISRSAYVFLNLPAGECVQLGGCVAI